MTPMSSTPVFRPGREWLLLALLTAAWTWWLTHSPGILQGLDYVRYYSLNAAWMRRSFADGTLPWWNPHLGLGRPFLADIQTGVLYPLHLLHLALGVPAATVVLIWLHLTLAAIGMTRLAAALGCSMVAGWLAAGVFVTGPALAARALGGQVHYVMGLCYLPVIFHLQATLLREPSDRRSALLALLSALQLLCGHPQVYWLTIFGLGVFTAGWSAGTGWRATCAALGRLLVACVLGLGLTAPVLLPFAQLVMESNRGEGHFSHLGALQPGDWLALVWPPSGRFVPDVEGSILVGAPVVVGAVVTVVARWRHDPGVRALTAMVLAAAVLASVLPKCAGEVVNALLPGFAGFRMPSRLGILVVMGLLLLAARGFRRQDKRWFAASVVLTLITLMVAWSSLRRWYVMPSHHALEPWITGLVKELQAGDAAGVPPRLNFSAKLLRENSGILTGHSTFNAYGSLYLRRPWGYVHAAAGLPEPVWINSFPDVQIFELPPFFSDAMNIVAGYDVALREVKLNPAPDPRAYVSFAVEAVSDWREAVRRMTAGHDFHRKVLVEPGHPVRDLRRGTGTVKVTRFADEEVVLQTRTTAPAVLVLAEPWYPGWDVWIDGAPAPAFPVNGWMRGVVVPAGTAVVTWRFRQQGFVPGCLVAAVALGGLAWWARRPSAVSREAIQADAQTASE